MEMLQTGKLFKNGVYKYQEGIRFDFTDYAANLYLYFKSPTITEIETIRKGSLKVGYYKEDEIILMLFKFEGMSWMDAPYSVHLSRNLNKLKEITDENSGYALNIFLIDANTGILKVMRLVSMSNRFSNTLRDKIENQRNQPFENGQFDRKLYQLYNKYNSKELANIMQEYCTI